MSDKWRKMSPEVLALSGGAPGSLDSQSIKFEFIRRQTEAQFVRFNGTGRF
jgi:hypothetical protein